MQGIPKARLIRTEYTIIDCQGEGRGFFFHSEEDSSSVVSGFTIKNGSAEEGEGGGIYCSRSSPTIIDNIITGNSSEDGGGGIYCNYSSPTITGNTITGNSATNDGGGGIYCNYSSPTITGNIITGNSASSGSSYYTLDGGGIYCSYKSSPTITGNTITGNSATGNGGGISCDNSSPIVLNTIIWANEAGSEAYKSIYLGSDANITITYSDIEGGWIGEGNIREDPLFANPENVDYRLRSGSPCIDAGDPESPLDSDGTRADIGVFFETVYTLSISVPDTSAAAGSTIMLPINVSSATGIAGVELVLSYDPGILTATGAQVTSLTSGFDLSYPVQTGKISITMAHSTGISGGSGAIVNVTFQVSPGASAGDTTSLILQSVSLYDESAEPIIATTVNGLFTVQTALEPGVLSVINTSPSYAIVEVGETLSFTATGVDVLGNPVAISPAWSVVPTEIGNVSTDGLLTATAWGEGSVIVTQEGVADTAMVIIGIRGDVYFDGVVDVRDAILCLRMIAGLSLPTEPIEHTTPTDYENWAGDVDNDGNVLSGDALQILAIAANRLLAKRAFVASDLFSEATVFLPNRLNGDILPVRVEDGINPGALDMVLRYDASMMEIVGVKAGREGVLVAVNTGTPGRLKLAMASLDGIAGENGTLLRLKVKARGELSLKSLEVEQIHMFDREAGRVHVQVKSELSQSTPAEFRLMQNRPNPFNPGTFIEVHLPVEGTVRLDIYNLQGQLVRTLLDGVKGVGLHRLYWDGRDGNGQLVSSGVYVCRMEAQEIVQSIKMIAIH